MHDAFRTTALPRRLATATRLLLLAVAAAALAGPARAEGERNANNPFGPRSGELPQALKDRGGDSANGAATSGFRRELFSLQTMTFAFVDRGGNGAFVRHLPDDVREADVRVTDKTRSLDKTFLYRAQCGARTFYFGPPPAAEAAAPALKPIDAGSVGDLLHQQLCG